VLTTLDAQLPVANLNIAVQEYGTSNASLIAGLEARGAHVEQLHVYDWDLPENVALLEENVQRIASGGIDVLLFTSGHQVVNVLKVAANLDLDLALRSVLQRTVVASIGPATSEMLRECELPVDLEPEHAKMGHLVQAAAERAAAILQRKRRMGLSVFRGEEEFEGVDRAAPWYNSPFMKACRLEPTERTPVWLMRQAGRYMAEYRAVRDKTTFLELCKNPQLCSEVMCTAVDRLGVDAAIIFSDLLPILEPMGMDLEFAAGEGPVIHNPVRTARDIERVKELSALDELHFVMQTVEQTRADLPGGIPLIGFAGAPFTLASYAIEGAGSRNYLFTKTLMYTDSGAWNALLGRLVRAIVLYLNGQIAAGAQAVQIFDSWVGCLGPDDYRRYVLPHMKELFAGLTKGVPAIHFATGNPALLPLLVEGGGSVIGVDWRVRLDDAWRTIGFEKAVQGNMDPTILLSTRDEIYRRAKMVLDQAGGHPGHIFNLGHGVMPEVAPEHVIALVDMVHELGAKRAAVR
jgi:uroporphyrinogen decarboxylase